MEDLPFAQMDSMIGMGSFGSRVYLRTSFTGGGGAVFPSIGALQEIVTEVIHVGLEVLRC